MLICPVCRSQNMDTAKFCGNCGNPFPRPSEATSSLINCPQGHVYSAVYQYCPYCPQPDSDDASNFITRVEEPVTSIDPQNAAATASKYSSNDFATRVDQNESLFETMEGPAAQKTPTTISPPILAPTEVITTIPSIEQKMDAVKTSETTQETERPPVNLFSREMAAPSSGQLDASAAPKLRPPEIQPPSAERTAQAKSALPSPAEAERRTIIMAEQEEPESVSRGKIIGWLITFSRNPDGEDYRIFSGYNRIGANPVCDIQIDDETVSGSHAIIVYREGRCLIKDDLSRNGTFVNGREITEAHTLKSYDQIRVGNTFLTFVAAERST